MTKKSEEQSSEFCKLCGEELGLHPEKHVWERHFMTLDEYREWAPGRPRAKVVDCSRVEIIREPPPPPPPPEAMVSVKLVDVPSNPNFESLEGRRGRTYNFSKSEWTLVAAPDYWIIVGGEDIPSKYPYLRFERRESKPQKRGKK